MASLKEIRSRIQSVANTKQVTYAMKLVSAAKLKKSQDAVVKSREYTDAMLGLLQQVVRAQAGDASHALLEVREEVKRVRLIAVGANRGLCGGYNTNFNRLLDGFYKEHAGKEIETIILGRKPAEYFRRTNRSYAQAFEQLHDDPSRWPLEELIRAAEHDYIEGKVDEVYVAYTKFKSAMTVRPTIEKFLPMSLEETTGEGAQDSGEATTIFEPSVGEVFSALLPRVMRGRLYQAFLDSKTSEHGSRMVAMDGATKNAGEMSKRLTRTLNKLRQEKVTAGLLDIIGGSVGD
jgi:F-type H+-transporting ATPase subunit gamma